MKKSDFLVAACPKYSYVFCLFSSSHYVQTFFIIAVMISVAVGTYRFCVDNGSTLSKVGFVGIALLCECILFRYVSSLIIIK